MPDTTRIKLHMEVIGADGVHVGTVDRVEGDRIKLTKADSGMGSHKGHHHFVPASLVAEVEAIRCAPANADVAVTFEGEAGLLSCPLSGSVDERYFVLTLRT